MGTSTQTAPLPPTLEPLQYQWQLRAHLRDRERAVWDWFAAHQGGSEAAEAIRFDLLKSTYRLDPQSHADLYRAAHEVAARLHLDVPITLYQAHHPSGLNASLVSLPQHAHLVFHGPISTCLAPLELRALLAHELTHLLLWRGWDGDFLVLAQVVAALAQDPQAETSHDATARLLSLYTEVFCDRGALFVVEDVGPVVSMLVKIETQLEDVQADSYLRQAEEIFQHGPVHTQQLTHPEAFIRARALQLWARDGARAEDLIAAMIEGPLVLERLDLVAQQRVADATRRVIDALMARPWMRSDPLLAHARLFFPDYEPPGSEVDLQAVSTLLQRADESLRSYFAFVLLDFVSADRQLDTWPLMAALELAERLELPEAFAELARRELRMRKGQLERIAREKAELLAAGPQELPHA